MKSHIITNKPVSGFSLVELLVVIAIIAVISALAIPFFTGAREAAVDAQASYNDQAYISMSNQLDALGYPGVTRAQLVAGTNVTVGGTNVTFRLSQ